MIFVICIKGTKHEEGDTPPAPGVELGWLDIMGLCWFLRLDDKDRLWQIISNWDISCIWFPEIDSFVYPANSEEKLTVTATIELNGEITDDF